MDVRLCTTTIPSQAAERPTQPKRERRSHQIHQSSGERRSRTSSFPAERRACVCSIRAAIRAFGVPMNKIVLLIRSRDVPHSPHPIVIDEVGLVHASVFPLFVRDKYWFRLILPLAAVPLQEANRIRPPKVVRGARIVNALGPFAFAGVPSPYISRTVSSTVAVPRPTPTPPRYRCQFSRCVADQLPVGR